MEEEIERSLGEIQDYDEKDIELARRLERVGNHILEIVKENGTISDFKEDVMYVINELLYRLSFKDKENLTATEIVNKQHQAQIQKEKEKHLESIIEKLQSENYEQNNIINSYIEERQAVIDKIKSKIKDLKAEMKGAKGQDRYSYKQEIQIYENILTILEGEKNGKRANQQCNDRN